MSAVKDGKIVEIGKLIGTSGAHGRRRGPGRRAGLYRQSLPLRRAGHLGPALHLLLRPRRDLGRVRQLLAVAGAGAKGPGGPPLRSSSSYVEAIPMEVLRTLEFTWESFPEYLDQTSTIISGSMSAISSAIPRSAIT